MAQRRIGIPYFGVPPTQYDRKYFSDLVRSFAQFANIMQNPGEGRFTKIVVTDMPTSDKGLEVGTLFSFGGNYVIITRANITHPAGAALVISGGSVTVTIA